MAKFNPVVEVYKGIKIRQCNPYQLRLSAVMFKILILESERTGLPISKILAFSSKPCERCSTTEVVAFNKDGDEVKIKRGILSRHMPEGNGTSIIQQAHAKTK
jgi:uncharacterized protein YcbX